LQAPRTPYNCRPFAGVFEAKDSETADRPLGGSPFCLSRVDPEVDSVARAGPETVEESGSSHPARSNLAGEPMALAIDRARLLRSLRMVVEPLGAGRFRVTGGRAPHTVLVRQDGPWACDCMDSTFHPSGRCKHTLAVYLTRQLARPVRTALRDALTVQESQGAAQ